MSRHDNPPYYLSAYSLALKAGFKGTLEEWLTSLKGDKVELRFFTEKIQWRWIISAADSGTEEDSTSEWFDLIDIAAIRGEIIERTLEDAESAAGSAEDSARRAEDSNVAAAASAVSAANSEKKAEDAAGAAAASEERSKTIIVNITQTSDGLTADKTYQELYTAISAQRSVSCRLPGGTVLGLVHYVGGGSVLTFQGENGQNFYRVLIKPDDTVTYESGQYALAEDLESVAQTAEDAMQTAENAASAAADAAELSKPYVVDVELSEGDAILADGNFEDILSFLESSRQVICRISNMDEQTIIRLSSSKYDDTAAYFSGVYDGKEYLVTITADGVTVDISEVGGGLTITDDGNGNVVIKQGGSNSGENQ